jgi:hypothetical protein
MRQKNILIFSVLCLAFLCEGRVLAEALTRDSGADTFFRANKSTMPGRRR